jgi:GNAT superfamily N-acetyltransferase
VSVPSQHSSAAQPLPFRAATASDAERLARAVVEELEGYRSFAPEGWIAPPVATEVAHLRSLLGDERVWCLLAETEGEVVGQITFLPAARAVHPVYDPALAHLRNLFVRGDRWGTGLATAIHAAAVGEARERGFSQMRLFTPAGQGRARRFYEREGWAAVGDEFHDPGPNLALVEYRRALGDRQR